MMNNKQPSQTSPPTEQTPNFLETDQILMIDQALCSVGEYGEVHLVVEKGRLRFIITQRSYDALKSRPGNFEVPALP